jgi:hypothetical protein
MFEQFFNRSARIQSLRDSPGGPLLKDFAKDLCQEGYAKITARRIIRASEHLLYWTDREGIPISSLVNPELCKYGY